VRKELRAWLRRLHEETHTTTILVTHDQEEAMEVADEVVLMARGKVEQTGPPRELYETPANEFVMNFVGAVSRVGDAYARPHDIEILLSPDEASTEAMVERIVHLGFEVRVELVDTEGEQLSVQLTRDAATELELARGDVVWVRARRTRVFA
jgi:sulfate transport system ATP-binding protein